MMRLALLVCLHGCTCKGVANEAAPQKSPEAGQAKPSVTTLDLDRNGRVTDDERIESRKLRLGKTLLQLDANKDGKVSVAELATTTMHYLQFPDAAAVDADGDGAISVDEVDDALTARRKAQSRWRDALPAKGD